MANDKKKPYYKKQYNKKQKKVEARIREADHKSRKHLAIK